MCVIIHMPKKLSLPTSLLQSGYDKNPHGWGIMAVIDGKIEVVKNNSNFNEFIKAWRQFPRDVERAIHFRWATHGEKVPENCHPFAVTPELYMMHNGIIQTVEIEKKMSDSWHFAKHDLGKPEIIDSWGVDALTKEKFKKMIEDCTSGSRLLFMDSLGRVLKTSYWHSYLGASFSNSSLIPSVTYNYPKRTTSPAWESDGSYANFWAQSGNGNYKRLSDASVIKEDAELAESFSDLLPYGRTIDGGNSQDYIPRQPDDPGARLTLAELEIMQEVDIYDWVNANPWDATDLLLELLGRENSFETKVS